jgi:hypothetical protein
MSSIVFQIENRKNENISALMDLVHEWADEHGMDYKRYDGYRDDMVHYWWKVHKLKDLMNENPEAPFILWFDSDIFIFDFKKDPRKFMTPDLDFVGAHDPDDPKDTEDWFNAGVFCVRNSESGRALIDKWISLYDPSKWSRDDDGKWVTEDRWAGPNYEQGSFCEEILQKTEFKNKIKILKSTIFNELFDWQNPGPECFSIHFMRGLAQKLGIIAIWRHRIEVMCIVIFLFTFFVCIKELVARMTHGG